MAENTLKLTVPENKNPENKNPDAEKTDEAAEKIPAVYKAPKGSYKATRLFQFYVATGTKVVPNAQGYYEPKSDEEREMLEYFASIDKVAKVS